MRLPFLVCGLFILILASACAPKVLTQSVPVSTLPAGASVLVDGRAGCQTPCSLDLTRNQDHILSVQKEGYRQQDVIVKRQYQSERVLLRAINSGYNSATFFNNPAMGLQSGVASMDSQEQTGEAYILAPSAVSLKLMPTAGFPRQADSEDVEEALSAGVSPLDLMDSADEHMLENALETTPSDQTLTWVNKTSGVAFALSLEPAASESGRIVRYATIGASQDGNECLGRYPAYRVGRGEWQVGLLQPEAAAPAAAPGGAGLAGVMSPGVAAAPSPNLARTLGEVPGPTVGKSWNMGSSSSTKTSVSKSGTVTQTTTKSSARAGVSVGPGAAMSILDALGGLGGQ
jgi:hypothetical protein